MLKQKEILSKVVDAENLKKCAVCPLNFSEKSTKAVA
jgi:hypothetical protein